MNLCVGEDKISVETWTHLNFYHQKAPLFKGVFLLKNL